MQTNFIDYQINQVKKNISFDGTREKSSNPYFSRAFEIQEPEETYHPGNTLSFNDLNAFVVDWEIPKNEFNT